MSEASHCAGTPGIETSITVLLEILSRTWVALFPSKPGVLSPLNTVHAYVVPPEAVAVTVALLQIVAVEGVNVKLGKTFTVTV